MKYYPPSNHIYYQDSDIPINKLDIHDSQLIHELERELLLQSYEFFHTTLEENTIFDKNYLTSIHHHLFEKLYTWAGEYRTINISKRQVCFAPT